MSSTLIPQHFIETVDAYLITRHVNSTHADVYLGLKIRNIGSRTVKVIDIHVDQVRPEQADKIIGIELRPYETFSIFIRVTSFNPSTSSTWESGTEHLLTIEYETPSGKTDTVSMKVIVG